MSTDVMIKSVIKSAMIREGFVCEWEQEKWKAMRVFDHEAINVNGSNCRRLGINRVQDEQLTEWEEGEK